MMWRSITSAEICNTVECLCELLSKNRAQQQNTFTWYFSLIIPHSCTNCPVTEGAHIEHLVERRTNLMKHSIHYHTCNCISFCSSIRMDGTRHPMWLLIRLLEISLIEHEWAPFVNQPMRYISSAKYIFFSPIQIHTKIVFFVHIIPVRTWMPYEIFYTKRQRKLLLGSEFLFYSRLEKLRQITAKISERCRKYF